MAVSMHTFAFFYIHDWLLDDLSPKDRYSNPLNCLLFQPQKGKQATKGQKQIVEENAATLYFYRNMVFIANGIYLTVTCVTSDTFSLQMIVSSYIFLVLIYRIIFFYDMYMELSFCVFLFLIQKEHFLSTWGMVP
jgi:hypothetical protein